MCFRVLIGHEDIWFNAKAYNDIMYIDGLPVLHIADDATRFWGARFLTKIPTEAVWEPSSFPCAKNTMVNTCIWLLLRSVSTVTGLMTVQWVLNWQNTRYSTFFWTLKLRSILLSHIPKLKLSFSWKNKMKTCQGNVTSHYVFIHQFACCKARWYTETINKRSRPSKLNFQI